MAFLDGLVGIKQVRTDSDPAVPQRATLHFVGAGFSVADDPTAQETVLTMHPTDGSVGTTVTPPSIGTDQTVYAPTGVDTADLMRLAISANVTLKGLAVPTLAGDPRKTITLISAGANYRLKLDHANTDAPAANRFSCPFGQAYYLLGDASVDILYDSTSQRWRVIP